VGWPDNPNEARQPVGVLILAAEDDLADTIVARLQDAGADLTRVWTLTTARLPNGRRSPVTIQDIARLEEVLKRQPAIALIIIDPIPSFLGRGSGGRSIDDHKNAELREVLTPLGEFAGKHHVAIVGNTHFGKTTTHSAANRVIGSVAYVNFARAVWCVVLDPENPERRLMLPAKCNLTPNRTGLAYTIADGVVAWEREPIDDNLDDVMAAAAGKESQGKMIEAAVWLAEFLRSRAAAGQITTSDEAETEGKHAGFGRKAVWKAKKVLKVQSVKHGFQGTWVWSMPD
jgi:hypothetical protein